MKIKRYEPPLNSQCLCGSGKKFKRCCYGEHTNHEKMSLNEAKILIKDKEYNLALKSIRQALTNYTICHKTNIEPYLSFKTKEILFILDIDIKALSEIVNYLIDCYRYLNQFDELYDDLERLRRNVNDSRWQRKITYFQILAKLGTEWDPAIGKKEVSKLQPILDESDSEIIQLYFQFKSEDISFTSRIKILDKLLSLEISPAVKLQYQVIKGINYLYIEDEGRSIAYIEQAIQNYESSDDEELYGKYQHAKAISLLGDLKKSGELKKKAYKIFREALTDPNWTKEGKAHLLFEMGKCLFHLSMFNEAIEVYKKSLTLHETEMVKIFTIEALTDKNDEEAINFIKKISISKLNDSEHYDYAVKCAYAGINFEDKDVLEFALKELKLVSCKESIFEKTRLSLVIEIGEMLISGKFSRKKQILNTLKKSMSQISRYFLLQPNIAGLGVNINNIIDDFNPKN